MGDQNEHAEMMQNEFDTVLSSIGDGVIVTDAEEKVIHVNHAAGELLHIEPEQVLGKPVSVLLQVENEKRMAHELPIDTVLEQGKQVASDEHYFLNTGQGEVTPISYFLAPIVTGEGGKPMGMVVTVRDMTREFEINKMKSEFVSIVSHQLRTPLSAIKWYLETLIENKKADPVSERQQEYLEQAFQSNERVISLINDLLNVSRLESGRMKMEREDVNLTEEFDIVLREQELFARANNVTLDCQFCEKELPLVHVDATKVRQVIQNLVSNGIKYSKGKSTLTINATVEESRIVYSIADEGMGIAEEDQKRLFEPFFRAEEAIASQTEGSGLGLYICRQILEMNEGEIWVESTQGEGSTFYFSAPIANK